MVTKRESADKIREVGADDMYVIFKKRVNWCAGTIFRRELTDYVSISISLCVDHGYIVNCPICVLTISIPLHVDHGSVASVCVFGI